MLQPTRSELSERVRQWEVPSPRDIGRVQLALEGDEIVSRIC